jgi:long-chain fatty acid transport protein
MRAAVHFVGHGLTSVDNDCHDTWQLALGAQYRSSPIWLFTGGISCDSSAVDDDERTVTVPMGEVWAFALGARHELTEDLTLGAAYTFAWLGDMPVDQAVGPQRISGEFCDSTFNFFAVNLKWTY